MAWFLEATGQCRVVVHVANLRKTRDSWLNFEVRSPWKNAELSVLNNIPLSKSDVPYGSSLSETPSVSQISL